MRKIKKQIENEFLEATKQHKEEPENDIEKNEEFGGKDEEVIVDKVMIKKKSKPKKIIVE